MKSFRKIIFWTHLITGLIAGVVILIMSVTGALLSFEKNIIEFAERDMRYVAASENTAKLPPSGILAKVIEAKPNAKPASITLPNEPNAAWQVALGRDGQVFVNPYTGAFTGEGASGVRSFFSHNDRLAPLAGALGRRATDRQSYHRSL